MTSTYRRRLACLSGEHWFHSWRVTHKTISRNCMMKFVNNCRISVSSKISRKRIEATRRHSQARCALFKSRFRGKWAFCLWKKSTNYSVIFTMRNGRHQRRERCRIRKILMGKLSDETFSGKLILKMKIQMNGLAKGTKKLGTICSARSRRSD